MKKIVMGILSVLPAALFLIRIIASKIAETLAAAPKYGGETPEWIDSFIYAAMLISAAAFVIYIIALVVFLIYNFKDPYISHDKKIGWAYMMVCIGVVAMPAYWYNFIRCKRF